MIELLGQLSNYLGLPSVGSSHGLQLDYMNGWVHWLMLILFIGWGAFFIFTIIKFRAKAHPKADYNGVQSSFSKYTEIGIIVFEAILLIGFAIPGYNTLKYENVGESNHEVEVRVVAQQFAWNIHYPGEDGKFGATRLSLVDEETNPLGLDRKGDGADDIVTLNQLHLPVDKMVKMYISSKDVIHSFSLPEMRVKQDAVPGMQIPIYFTPTMTSEDFLSQIKDSERDGMGYEITCAQLCGNSHYRMRGFMTIHEEEGYNKWLSDEAEYLDSEGEDDWDDGW